MKTATKLLLTGVFLSFAAGCSNSGTEQGKASKISADKTEQHVTDVKFEEIAWEDLMPAGEDERLESLYLEFYEEFERNMRQGSSTLAEAAKDSMASENDDMSAFVAEGSAADTMEQIGTFNVVNDLNGKRIRVPGYVVPFDFSADAEHTEFLLVPYF